MSEYKVMTPIIMFVVTLLLTSRMFYFLELKYFCKRKMKQLALNMQELDVSYEQMVYFTPLPSNLPYLKSAKKEDLHISFDYTSLLIPQVTGIKVQIKDGSRKRLLAYLPIKNFRLPTLDKLQHIGKIDETTYLKLSTYKLSSPATLKHIVNEVHKNIQVGRNRQL